MYGEVFICDFKDKLGVGRQLVLRRQRLHVQTYGIRFYKKTMDSVCILLFDKGVTPLAM